jgi:hypothetical protein
MRRSAFCTSVSLVVRSMKLNILPVVPRFVGRSDIGQTVSSRVWVVLGILATVILAGSSFVAVGVLGCGPTRGGTGSLVGVCTVPNLCGFVVNVIATNRGGPMMGGGGSTSGGAMGLTADRVTVPCRTVLFLVTNGGSVTHELVVLRPPESQIMGIRLWRQREDRRGGQSGGGIRDLRRRLEPSDPARSVRLGERHAGALPV